MTKLGYEHFFKLFCDATPHRFISTPSHVVDYHDYRTDCGNTVTLISLWEIMN